MTPTTQDPGGTHAMTLTAAALTAATDPAASGGVLNFDGLTAEVQGAIEIVLWAIIGIALFSLVRGRLGKMLGIVVGIAVAGIGLAWASDISLLTDLGTRANATLFRG